MCQVWVIVSALIDRPQFESRTKSSHEQEGQVWLLPSGREGFGEGVQVGAPAMLAIADAKNDEARSR